MHTTWLAEMIGRRAELAKDHGDIAQHKSLCEQAVAMQGLEQIVRSVCNTPVTRAADLATLKAQAAFRKGLRDSDPDSYLAKLGLWQAGMNLGRELAVRRKHTEALEAFDEAIGALNPELERSPRNYRIKRYVAIAEDAAAGSEHKIDSALVRRRRSIALWGIVVENDPANHFHVKEMAAVCRKLNAQIASAPNTHCSTTPLSQRLQ